MNFHLVKYELSCGLASQLPESTLPEVVFAGRSNVGKSSLINKVFNQKQLARVSATPGKTSTINYFRCGDTARFADLPGYGYAKRSFAERDKWSKLFDRYFSLDTQILFLQLVDLKVGLTKDDAVMLNFLKEQDLPFAIVATKADKLNKTNREKCIAALHDDANIPDDAVIIPFSSQNGEGKDELWQIISEFAEFVYTGGNDEEPEA